MVTALPAAVTAQSLLLRRRRSASYDKNKGSVHANIILVFCRHAGVICADILKPLTAVMENKHLVTERNRIFNDQFMF